MKPLPTVPCPSPPRRPRRPPRRLPRPEAACAGRGLGRARGRDPGLLHGRDAAEPGERRGHPRRRGQARGAGPVGRVRAVRGVGARTRQLRRTAGPRAGVQGGAAHRAVPGVHQGEVGDGVPRTTAMCGCERCIALQSQLYIIRLTALLRPVGQGAGRTCCPSRGGGQRGWRGLGGMVWAGGW